MAREGSAAPNLTRIGALGGEKRWRETGAKKGDFPASNRYDWLLEGTVCYRDFNRLALAASLAKVGVGYGLMLPLSPSPPAASAAVYFQSPEAKSAEPQNQERPALGCCLSPSIRLGFW